MPNCCECGCPVENLPKWIETLNVRFRCAECPGGSISEAVLAPFREDIDEDETLLATEPEAEDAEDEEVEPEVELED